ncbi:MBL fold metallo-hydrolase, partial [Candidatus Sumerlaeota bacterium]|nr:MBL fold metallo-hydrolase [Candidatus Sumerlaeota bacterium]
VPSSENVERLGKVDILMAAIDSTYHILNEDQIEEIRSKLQPRVLIPIHFFHPSLTKSSRFWLGRIDPWLEGKPNVTRLQESVRKFSPAELPQREQIVVFPPSPKVPRP